MTTLRVVVEQLFAKVPGGIGRYTEELTHELIATAPAGCEVEGISASHDPEQLAEVTARFPGLVRLTPAPIGRKELSRAWQYGIPIGMGGGMIHAPSMFAPLVKHDRLNKGDQTVVTIMDVVPWTHPETLTAHGAAWHKAMGKRALKHADAIVVPTHAIARQLSEFLDFGDRVRVIGGAVSRSLLLPDNAEERAAELKLPEKYVLSVGTLEPRKGIQALIAAMGRPVAPDIPLLIVGPSGWGDLSIEQLTAEAGLAPGSVRSLGFLSDSDLAIALDRATVFAYPSLAEGFGLPLVEAFQFGTPVVHSDDDALVEVAGGAGLVVEREDTQGYPDRLAYAIASVVSDRQQAMRLGVAGRDRAKAFSWRDSAERVWQLHADL